MYEPVKMRATTIQQVAALAVSLRNVQAAPNDTVIAANLEHYWSYGRSPPVYPSPQLSGTGGWAESLEYARQLMSQMTNDEKNNLTYGYVLKMVRRNSTDCSEATHLQRTDALAISHLWSDLAFPACVFKIVVMVFVAPMESMEVRLESRSVPRGIETLPFGEHRTWVVNSKARVPMLY